MNVPTLTSLFVLFAVVLPASPPPVAPVSVTLNGSIIQSVTSSGVTVPAGALVHGTSNANATLFGTGADADDLDLSSYFAKNGDSNDWDVDLVAWADTNGTAEDFFVFEAGGNDNVQMAAWFPDGSFGQAVNLTGWTSTGYTLSSGPNSNQTVFGAAMSVTSLLDAQGSPLTTSTVLRGVRITSATIDGCAFAAIDPVGAVDLPPTANAGPDRVVALPATTAMLDGTASFDAEDPSTSLVYAWTQTSGAPATLTDPSQAMTAATGLTQGLYEFELTVTDTAGGQSSDRVSVFVVPQGGSASLTGELRKWHRITLTFPNGPPTSETATPNPFLDYRLDVTFTHAGTGKSLTVPGFFAADGSAESTHATAGTTWRAHFLPDEIGTWAWNASFVTGTDIAIAPNAASGTPLPPLDGSSGSFVVGTTDKVAPDFRGRGLLRYRDKHHLVFAETGERYIKGGADSPENFLGYYGFDNTYDNGGLATPGLVNGLHRFQPHAGDWNPGDPDWTDEDGDDGRNIIGALNYVASQGVNSVYFLTYNIDGGDGRDSWPWISTAPNEPTASEMLRFDCSKLAQWEILFTHMDTLGIQLHVVTQETENDNVMGGLNTVRRLYYRELVARFAHHHALIWNIGEENTNSNNERMDFAALIRDLDAYEHPICVHTQFNGINATTGLGSPYTALYGDPSYEATSLQGTGSNYNGWAISIRNQSANAGRPWVIYGDEQGPRVDDNLDNLDVLREESLWGNLMGGGAGVEWYFGYQGTFGDVQSEDWRQVEALWQQTDIAVRFMQQHTRFWEMEGRNDLVSGSAWCLAKPGERYAVYTDNAAAVAPTLDVEASTDTFTVGWVNPRTGAGLGSRLLGTVTTITGPGAQPLGLPPAETSQDWVCVVLNENIAYYGAGAVSSNDQLPSIDSLGSPTIPNMNWGIGVGDVPAGNLVYLLIGVTPASVNVGPGDILVTPAALAPPFLSELVADSSGAASLDVPLGNVSALVGIDLYLQAVVVDTATEGNIGLSEGLRVTLH